LLYAKKAGTREVLSIFFAPPNIDGIAPEVHLVLDRLDQSRARAMLVYVNYICARLFRFEEHRENVLRGPLTLFIDRFGPDVVPDDVRVSVPALVAALCRDHGKNIGAPFAARGHGRERDDVAKSGFDRAPGSR
jgi:hypothetical protein